MRPINQPYERYRCDRRLVIGQVATIAIYCALSGLFGLQRIAAAEKPSTPKAKLSTIDNGVVRIGIDLNQGGAITYLSEADRDDNVINNYDFGRQVQMAYYAGPVPYEVGGKKPADHWRHIGWNPIQTGDDFGHSSQIIEHKNDGKSIYVKSIPMHWPLNNVPAACTFETWIELEGRAVKVKCRFVNQRADKKQYIARTQELPAVYVNGPYYRLMTYTGDKPFTGDKVSRITYTPTPEAVWTSWYATENWAAHVNDAGFGLGIWQPDCYRFSGGFAGKHGQGGTTDVHTGYIAPNKTLIIDHDIQHEYNYTLILGSIEQIRQYIYKHAQKPKPPKFLFARDRQDWHLRNAMDKGWNLNGHWHIHLKSSDPQLWSPRTFWQARDASVLRIEAAFNTTQKSATVFFSTLKENRISADKSLSFDIKPDGQFHTYDVDLSPSQKYKGVITRLRLDPVGQGGKGQSVKIRSIQLVDR